MFRISHLLLLFVPKNVDRLAISPINLRYVGKIFPYLKQIVLFWIIFLSLFHSSSVSRENCGFFFLHIRYFAYFMINSALRILLPHAIVFFTCSVFCLFHVEISFKTTTHTSHDLATKTIQSITISHLLLLFVELKK